MNPIKYFSKCIIFIVLIEYNAFSIGDTTYKYDVLKTPDSPGFEILGSTPSSIARPETPKDIAISINSLLNNKNFGIELSPYKLFNSTVTYHNLYENILYNLWKDFTVSTSSIETNKFDSLLNGDIYGIGFRTKIFDGAANSDLEFYYSNKKFINVQNKFLVLGYFNNILTDLKEKKINISTGKQFKEYIDTSSEFKTNFFRMIEKEPQTSEIAIINEYFEFIINNIADYDSIQEFISFQQNTTAQELSEVIQKINKRKVGFFLELAGAVAFNIPDTEKDIIDGRKHGFWITPSYRWEFSGESNSYIDLLGVYRAIYDKRLQKGYSDYGFRVLFEYQKTNFSFDLIKRTQENDFRFMGMIEYSIDSDISIYCNFGKDFINPADKNRNKIDIGINCGYGNLSFL